MPRNVPEMERIARSVEHRISNEYSPAGDVLGRKAKLGKYVREAKTRGATGLHRMRAYDESRITAAVERIRVKALKKGIDYIHPIKIEAAIEESERIGREKTDRSTRLRRARGRVAGKSPKFTLPKGPTSILKEGVMGLAIKHSERVHGLLRKSARKRSEQLGLMPKSKEM